MKLTNKILLCITFTLATVFNPVFSMECGESKLLNRLALSQKDAVNIALRDINNKDEHIRQSALHLFIELFKYGKAFKEATNSALYNVYNANPEIRKTAYKLLHELFKRQKGVTNAINTAFANIINADDLSIDLLIEVYKTDKTLLEKIDFILNNFNSNDLRVRIPVLKLIAKLVQIGEISQLSIDAAILNANNDNEYIQILTLGLLIELVKKGQAFDTAINAALNNLNHNIDSIQMKALELISELLTIKQEFVIPVVKIFIENNINSEDEHYKASAFRLLVKLVDIDLNKNIVDEELKNRIFQAIKINIQGNNKFLKILAHSLFTKIFAEKYELKRIKR